MALETANYVNDLDIANPAGGDGKAQGDDHLRLIKKAIKQTFPNQANPLGKIIAVNANRTMVATDANCVFQATAAVSLTLTAAATLGTPWAIELIADGGDITLVRSGSDTINGVASATIPNGGIAKLFCTGAKFFLSVSIPAGIITAWSGSAASIPSGWYLCDGTNGTPNLRDRFIIGAGSTYAVGATGGSADSAVVAHTHTASVSITDPGHAHGTYQFANIGADGSAAPAASRVYASGGATAVATTGISASATVNSAGGSATNANLPPYYALAWIMKA